MSCTWPCGDLEQEMLACRESLIKELGVGGGAPCWLMGR